MPFFNSTFRPLVTLLLILGSLLLSACGRSDPASRMNIAASFDTRLGTGWGEDLNSRVTTADFQRISEQPVAMNMLHYSAAAQSGEVIREIRVAQSQIGIRVLKDNGSAWPIYFAGGREHVQGRRGERYILEYRNLSKDDIFEIVATVDGLDVLSGRPGSIRNRGYALRPGETLRIEGFRKSRDEVAAFRFSGVDDSYAANSGNRSTANIGVIGTAAFRLYNPAPDTALVATQSCQPGPCAFPKDPDPSRRSYAAPPT